MSCRPKSVAVCEGPGWGWLNGAEARGGDGDGPRTAARPMDLPCPVGGGETTHGPTMSIGKRKDAPWTLRVHWEEEKCPTDPPCPLGRGEMPHGPSVSSGRRSDAPWTPHVHWDPLCPWRRRRDAPWTPPPHVQWEEERLRRSCGPERCFLPTCVHCDCGAAEEGVSVSVVPLRGFPSVNPSVGCATQAMGSGGDTHSGCAAHGVLCTDVVRVVVHWVAHRVLSHRCVTC